MKRFSGVLLAALVLGSGLVVTSISSAAPPEGYLRTTPERPNGWTPQFTRVSGGAPTGPTGSVEYTGGPKVPDFQGKPEAPPYGAGSLTLKVGSDANTVSAVRNGFLDGSPLRGIQLTYSFITTKGNVPSGATTNSSAPALALDVVRDGKPPDRLTYEPYLNSSTCAAPYTQWKFNENAGEGLWWSSSEDPNYGCGGVGMFTLDEYQTKYPSAVVASVERGGLRISVGGGGGEDPNLEGSIDEITARRADTGAERKWEFEPSIARVSSEASVGWNGRAVPSSNSAVPPRVTLVDGPGSPLMGFGSLELQVGDLNQNVAEAANSRFDGRNLPPEAMSYGTYVSTQAAASRTCEPAPYLELDVQRAATAANASQVQQTLRFHPCDQGVVSAGAWQRWDAAQGTWRWEETQAALRVSAEEAGADCSRAPECRGTLQQYSATYPGDERVVTRSGESGGFRVGVGGAGHGPATQTSWAGFTGNVDYVNAEFGDAITYDFEGQQQTAPTTQAPSTGGPGGGGGNDTGTPVQGGTTTTTSAPGTTTTTTQPGNTTTTAPTTSTTRRPSNTGDQDQMSRAAGSDRMATAIAVSRKSYADQSAGAVVLARADSFPDALAAGPLAANRRGPLLLTPSNRLDDLVVEELRRVLPSGRPVHLAGGRAALDQEVENRLRAEGFVVARHAGRNRFETATLIAEQVGSPNSAFLVSGLNFADALPGGAAAAAQAGVVLLTADAAMPSETAAYLNARPGLRRYAVGGQAAAADRGAEPLVGEDRFATSVVVAERLVGSSGFVGIASGATYPDALAGGPFVGSRGGPLLLTRPEVLPGVVEQYLAERRRSISEAVVFGGDGAISPRVFDQVRAAID
jgi:hypothetical protein